MHNEMLHLASVGMLQYQLPPDIPRAAVDLIQSFFLTFAVVVLGYPIIKALTRRFVDRAPVAPPLSPDVASRLERIEQAVDAIAIEVERVSEAQRFQTRLMTEARALPGASAVDATGGSSRSKDPVR